MPGQRPARLNDASEDHQRRSGDRAFDRPALTVNVRGARLPGGHLACAVKYKESCMGLIKRYWAEEAGMETVEWAIMAALIVAGLVLVVQGIGTECEHSVHEAQDRNDSRKELLRKHVTFVSEGTGGVCSAGA